jgi:hypothetical protein
VSHPLDVTVTGSSAEVAVSEGPAIALKIRRVDGDDAGGRHAASIIS